MILEELGSLGYIQKIWDEDDGIHIVAEEERRLRKDVQDILYRKKCVLETFKKMDVSLEDIFLRSVKGEAQAKEDGARLPSEKAGPPADKTGRPGMGPAGPKARKEAEGPEEGFEEAGEGPRKETEEPDDGFEEAGDGFEEPDEGPRIKAPPAKKKAMPAPAEKAPEKAAPLPPPPPPDEEGGAAPAKPKTSKKDKEEERKKRLAALEAEKARLMQEMEDEEEEMDASVQSTSHPSAKGRREDEEEEMDASVQSTSHPSAKGRREDEEEVD
jgi:hypothetical protein